MAREETICTLRAHPQVLAIPVLLLFAVAALVGVGLALLPPAWHPVGDYLLLGLGALTLLWRVVGPLLTWLGQSTTLTTERIILRQGLLSRESADLPWNRVASVTMSRNLRQWLTGCGTLRLHTLSGRDILLADMPTIKEVYRAASELTAEKRADLSIEPWQPPR